MADGPRVTVVVPSHRRRLRLRWLLNSLEEQTLAAEDFEVVVVHTYDDETTRELFADRRVHQIQIPVSQGAPARQRNLGWRAASAPLIAFTDDDCRADPHWLEELLAVADREPGRIVQGATRHEPFEALVHAAPHVRTLHIDPPTVYAQTCNIAYPVPVLERVGGFDESFPGPAGEDTDLAVRAGGDIAAAPGAVVFHAVEEYSLLRTIRLNHKWSDVPFVISRHPHLRELFWMRLFWRTTHRDLVGAAIGVVLARRFPPAALLAVPYLRSKLRRRGNPLVAAVELPGQVLVDAAEVGSLVYGSAKHRTLVL